jgi:hypothetical protein
MVSSSLRHCRYSELALAILIAFSMALTAAKRAFLAAKGPIAFKRKVVDASMLSEATR